MQNSKMPLMDDFAIFDIHANVIGTIEYNGKQHYMIVDFGNKDKTWAQKELEKTKARDKVKSDYLAVHNIPQLIIPYWSFDDIEVIVINFIKELSKKHILC